MEILDSLIHMLGEIVRPQAVPGPPRPVPVGSPPVGPQAVPGPPTRPQGEGIWCTKSASSDPPPSPVTCGLDWRSLQSALPGTRRPALCPWRSSPEAPGRHTRPQTVPAPGQLRLDNTIQKHPSQYLRLKMLPSAPRYDENNVNQDGHGFPIACL